jgi:outer membrane receptor protein involved in Fe transport
LFLSPTIRKFMNRIYKVSLLSLIFFGATLGSAIGLPANVSAPGKPPAPAASAPAPETPAPAAAAPAPETPAPAASAPAPETPAPAVSAPATETPVPVATAPATESPVPANLPAIGKVGGQLLDESNNEPLMFASIVLFRERDSTMVTGGISDELGRFLIEKVPFGRYYLSINYIGYPKKEVGEVVITPRATEYNTGLIRVAPGAEMLSEVTVEASRQLMEVGLDRRVFNVDQELTANGGSAIEVMQNIPSVAVDFDGNVSLRGSSNVTILIDGRPSGLTGLSGSEALEQIPSNMIDRIEVITNPSVRYAPDGTSGIINIVLKKERRAGYNGMLSLTASTRNNYNGSLNLNYKVNDLNLFANYSGRAFNRDGYGRTFRTNFLSDTTFMDQRMDYENTMNSHNFTLGADYQLNAFNSLTFSVMYNSWDRAGLNNTDYSALSGNQDITSLFNRFSGDEMDNSGLSYTLNYRRTFDERLRELNTDIVFSDRSMTRSEDNIQRFLDLNSIPDGRPNLLESTRMDAKNWMFSVQTDYVQPLGEDRKLEVGGRIYMREMDSDFNFLGFDHQASEWMNNPGLSNRFVFSEQVFSAYGIFSTMAGPYSIQAGLRAEQALIEANQRTTNDVFNNQYFSLFPSMHLRRNFENNQNAQISYSRRISRPNNRILNPFVSYSDPYDLSYGNPRLNPEYINSLELGYTKFWEKTTLNPSLFYRYTNGMITRFRTMDENGIAYTTWENLNTGVSYGAEMVASHQLASWYRVNGTFSYFRQIVEGGDAMMEMRNDSYSWSARMVNNFTFPRGWSAQLNAYYRSPVVMIQGEMREMYAADAAVRKNVLNNRGTITLRLSDVFNTQRFRMYNYGNNFAIDTERVRNSRMLYLGFSYRINEFDRNNQQRRRTQQGGDEPMIDMDDF